VVKATVAVASAPGAALRLEEVTLDQPRPGELLIRLVASGVCHTDVLAQAGKMPFPLPGVLGHEGVGVVQDVGDGVEGFAIGDAVLLGWPWCGSCKNCYAGRPRYCAQQPALLFGGARTLRRNDGTLLHGGFFGQSSFASHTLVDARSAVKVQTSLPLEAVGTLGCGFSAGAGAVLHTARPEPGSAVVVYGAGAVGLAAVMAARLTPATTIVAVEQNPQRLELARKLGATETVDVTGLRNVARAVREACGGPADIAIECTGQPRVIRQAIETVGTLGLCCLVGTADVTAEFSAHQQSTLRGKRIQGSMGGESQSHTFVPALLRLAEQGRFPFTGLIEYLPFDDPQAALTASASAEVVKPVLLIGR
jgi:aryl-alcohol dehydrogenase